MRIRKIRLPLAAIAAFSMAACDAPYSGAPTEPVEVEQKSNVRDHPAADRVPYGVSVPSGEEVTGGPEPYDPRRHGPLIPNTDPGADISAQLAGKLPRLHGADGFPGVRPRRSDEILVQPQPEDSDLFAGVYVHSGAGLMGWHEFEPDMSLPAGSGATRLVFAPTTYPPQGCWESTTVYQASSTGATFKSHGFWNHCRPKADEEFEEFIPIDPDFGDKYIRVLSGTGLYVYWTMVYNTNPSDPGNGAWYGLLYNWNLGGWEYKTDPVTGLETEDSNVGWTIWEGNDLDMCPILPQVESGGLELLTSAGSWVALTPSYTSAYSENGSCWEFNDYIFGFYSDNDHWVAITDV